MDEEDYEDYLVDKAKELLNEELTEPSERDPQETPSAPESPEMKKKRNEMDEMAEKQSTSKIPVAWDPREIEHLVENRKKMNNKELKDFLKKDSELQEDVEEVDDWKGFTRWEERFIIQNYQGMDAEELAEELGRDTREVKLKTRIMGLKLD